MPSILPNDEIPVLNPKLSPLQLYKGPEHLVRGSESDMAEAFKTLEDGRMYFALDTKKIYVDCDFETSDGQTIQDRLSFGGNGGIFYGQKDFNEDEEGESRYEFWLELGDLEKMDEIPCVDDLILNKDGCFYRVVAVEQKHRETYQETETGEIIVVESEELYTVINTEKLTIAGSGGGGGGAATTIYPVLDHSKSLSFILAKKSMPIYLKVSDSQANTSIDITATVQGQPINNGDPIRANIPQGEWFVLDLYRYESAFSRNAANRVVLTFRNEYNSHATLTISPIQLVDLQLVSPVKQLPTQKQPQFNINLYPYGVGSMDHWELYSTLHFPNGQANDLTTHYAPPQNTGNGNYFQYGVNLSAYSTGSYSYDFWIRAWPKGYENEDDYLESKPISIDFIYQNQNASTPYLQFGLDDKSQTTYTVNSRIPMHYTVSFRDSGSIAIRREVRLNGAVISNVNATVNYDDQYTWDYVPEAAGSYEFIIYVDAFNISETTGLVTVEQGENELPVINPKMPSLQLYLKAAGKSNTDDDRDTWTYVNGNTTVVGRLIDFNWTTNGWQTVDGAAALHLTNGAKLEVPFQVFAQNAFSTGKTVEIDFKLSNVRDVNQVWLDMANWRIQDNKLNCGIVGTGDKICINTKEKINYHTPEEDLALSEEDRAATNGLRAYLAEDTRVHVTFTMEDNTPGNTNLIYTYVNGIMSGVVVHTDTDAIVDNLEVDESNPVNRKSFIRIDSTYADIDIYSIRVYSQFFSDGLVLDNYIADLPSVANPGEVWRRNQALTGDGKNISLPLVKNLHNIAYGVLIDHGSTTDKKGKEGITDTSTRGQTPNTKEDFHMVSFYYVDPEHPDRNIGVTTNAAGEEVINPVDAVIYGQGTSSLQYPVKNLRLRFKNKADNYSLLPAIPVGATEDPATVEARWSNMPKVALFTFKTDYMDSSMAHNTGIGNMLSSLYESVNLKTPAQEYYSDQTIVNNVVGTPCLLFYRADDNNTTDPQFIGRYNFNTDKDSKDDSVLFGLTPDKAGRFGVLTTADGQNLRWGFIGTIDEEYDSSKNYYTQPVLGANGQPDPAYLYDPEVTSWKDYTYLVGPLYEYVEGPGTIQCWEFLNNPPAMTKFQVGWNEETDRQGRWTKTSKGKTKTFAMPNWCECFESRYPVYDTEVMTDKRAWLRVINWLVSTNQATATNEPLGFTQYGYDTDCKEYRLKKFQTEFDDYFVRDFVAFYYVLTETLLMVDSRAKNMMMACFDADPENPDPSKRGHWMPWFYDMDTSLGVDNSGILKFPYDTDDDTENYAFNAKANYGAYNDQGDLVPTEDYSVLWANFREAFHEDISTMYNRLRAGGKFNYNYISRALDDKLATKFAEIYDNMDAKWKFIRPLTEETTVMDPNTGELITKVGIDWTQATQGTRELHRKHFLNHRLAMLDSKYPRYAEAGKDTGITLRLEGLQTQFELTSASTQYGVVYVGKNMPPVKLLPNVPTLTGETGLSTVSNLETYIWNLGDIYDIGNIANMKPNQISFPVANKLRSLKLGQTDVPRDEFWAKACALGVQGKLTNTPLLELLDLRNVKLTYSTVDASQCAYLRDVYAKGSNASVINFVRGGTLRHVELPASVTAFYLDGHLTLNTITDPDNLQFEDITNLRDLAIEKSPNVDTLSLVNQLMAAGINLDHIRLPDVNWTIEPGNDTCIYDGENHITDIKVLEYLSHFPGLDASYQQIYNPAGGNLFLAGTVHINNGTGADGVGIDVYALSKKYSLNYPQLKIEYDENPNNVTGYRINVHPAGSMAGSEDIVGYNTVSGRENSTVKSVTEILELDWRDYLENHIDYPAKEKDGQWIYTFKGWNYTTSVMSDIESEVTAALDIPIVTVGTDGMDASAANAHLTLSQFDENNILHLYPVYQKTLRQFLVRFYNVDYDTYVQPAGESPETPVLNDPQIHAYYYVTWGEATPIPDAPSVITLDSNDKSKAMIKSLDYYDTTPGPLNRITSNAQYFPVWKDAQDMSTVTNPSIDYFEVTQLTAGTLPASNVPQCYVGSRCIKATIKASFQGEAIVVPLEIDGRRVVTLENKSTTVKRIFFEKGNVAAIVPPGTPAYTIPNSSNILYFTGGGTAGFGPASSGDAVEGTNAVSNPTLEYIEFGACKQLKVIGQNETAFGCEFAGCPNLYVPELPDSLIWIGNSAFRNNPGVCFTKLPKSLSMIGSYAFRKCTGLEYIDTSDHVPELPAAKISNGAFDLCSNLSFDPNYGFDYWSAIGDYAFRECTNLTAWGNATTAGNSAVRTIGANAFKGCARIELAALPINLEVLGSQAFDLINQKSWTVEQEIRIKLATIPYSLTAIGKEAFRGCRLEQTNGNSLNMSLNAAENYTYLDPDAFAGLDAFKINTFGMCDDIETALNTWLEFDENGSPYQYSYKSTSVLSKLPLGAVWNAPQLDEHGQHEYTEDENGNIIYLYNQTDTGVENFGRM